MAHLSMSITILSEWNIDVVKAYGVIRGIHIGYSDKFGTLDDACLLVDAELGAEYYAESSGYHNTTAAWRARNCDIYYDNQLYMLMPTDDGLKLHYGMLYLALKPDWIEKLNNDQYWFEISHRGKILRGVIDFPPYPLPSIGFIINNI